MRSNAELSRQGSNPTRGCVYLRLLFPKGVGVATKFYLRVQIQSDGISLHLLVLNIQTNPRILVII
jgi:hypothetical protein